MSILIKETSYTQNNGEFVTVENLKIEHGSDERHIRINSYSVIRRDSAAFDFIKSWIKECKKVQTAKK